MTPNTLQSSFLANTSSGETTSQQFSQGLVRVLQNNTLQQTIHEIITQSRYQELSTAEQACVQCFLHAKKDETTINTRAARNHHRADIGAWLLMHHLPVHPLLSTLTNATHPRLQELLPDEDDRHMFQRCCRIHTHLHLHDLEGYLSYIQALPPEEQSLTIQTYKQLIIGRMSHPNGHSIYFPYLSAEKSNIPYDLSSLYAPELLQQFPGYQEQLDLLRSSPEHISPPRTAVQELFHDIMFMSTVGYQLKSPELLHELHKIRSDPRVGLVAPHAYPRELFVSLSDPGPLSAGQASTEVAKQSEDSYLLHSYTTLSSMWGCTKTLLQDRATLHEAYEKNLDKDFIFKKLRKCIKLISKLHQRIDVHYFIRHLPSQSDISNSLSKPNEAISNKHNNLSDKAKYLFYLFENHSLLLSSEWQYAIMSTSVLLGLWDDKSNIRFQANIYGGLNNQDKHELIPILKSVPINLSLVRLLDYLNILPTTSIHITHGRVLKWIRDTYGFKNAEAIKDESTSYLIPIYRGSYQEDGVCSSPEERIKTIEQLRLLVHEYTATHNILLEKYRTSVHQDALQSFSTNDFCYRIVDCLRKIAYQDKDLSTYLYEQLLEVSCSTKTIHRFLEEHHELIHRTPTDEHTE